MPLSMIIGSCIGIFMGNLIFKGVFDKSWKEGFLQGGCAVIVCLILFFIVNIFYKG